MTVDHIRRFTCGKCGAVEETAADRQAPRWSRLVIVEPPLCGPLEAPTLDIHLCEACTQRAYALYIPASERA